MTGTANEASAWAALLPGDAVWLPGDTAAQPGHRRLAARRLRGALAGLPPGSTMAAAAAPWELCRGNAAGEPGALRAYLAVPSVQRPLIVASCDPAVLRYLADSVLSVPPGTGPLPSMVLTAGLRLLRIPAAWTLAVVARAAGVVLVGRPG